jgi:hypothetical protein
VYFFLALCKLTNYNLNIINKKVNKKSSYSTLNIKFRTLNIKPTLKVFALPRKPLEKNFFYSNNVTKYHIDNNMITEKEVDFNSLLVW